MEELRTRVRPVGQEKLLRADGLEMSENKKLVLLSDTFFLWSSKLRVRKRF